MMDWIRTGAFLVPYVFVRASSYILNPRPYLWWHGLLDAGMILCLLAVLWLSDKYLRRRL